MAAKKKTKTAVRKARQTKKEAANTLRDSTHAEVQEMKALAAPAGQYDGILRHKEITSERMYDKVATAVRVAVNLRKDVEDAADKILKPLNAARKEVMAQKNAALKGVKKIEEHGRSLLQAHAVKQKEEAIKAVAKQVRAAEKVGASQLAKDIVSAAIAEVTAPEESGVTNFTYRRARITNMALFLKALGEANLPHDLVKIDQSALNAWARLNEEHEKGKFGVEVYLETSVRVAS